MNDPIRDRKSLESSCKFIEEHVATRKCDSPAVSECWRCNSAYLAKRMRELLTTFDPQGRAQPAQAEITDAELPTLPTKVRVVVDWDGNKGLRNYYTDEQMCEYARTAIRASKGGV